MTGMTRRTGMNNDWDDCDDWYCWGDKGDRDEWDD